MAEVGGMSSTSAMSEAPKKPENETIDPSPIDHQLEFSKPITKATINPTIFSSETSLLEEILQEPEEQETTARAESKISCDESERRSDTCAVHGDVRVVGYSSSIILAINRSAPAVHGEEEEEEEEEGIRWKIRPYSRKWETTVMGRIRELTLKESTKPPHCSVNHTVPGIVFSTGGFLGNFFHDFSDVLIPLFTTARRHRGRVQFLVADFNYRWIAKYETILRRLSYYPIIDLDQERSTVHCFLEVHVGLLSHRELGIDPSKAPDGDSMADFREFLRSCFALSREKAVARSAGRKKPRLLLIDRRGSRSITNRREVSSLARSLGFKVLVAGPEETKNVSKFSRTVNSCDVLMGVHGAGLTNMVFLPRGATLVQIVPWGGLASACRHDFGDPAADMEISYLQEYEVKEDESSLIRQYPRHHAVFTDPLSIHKQGWDAIWSVFLDKQTVKVDVRRLRGVLEEALQLQGSPAPHRWS